MLIKIIIFYTSRLVDSRHGIEERAVRLLQILLTHVPLSKCAQHVCLKEILLHPVVIEKFKPLSHEPGNLTSLTMYIISLLEDEKEDLTYNYRKM